ncbi:MAG: hypothetical protein GXO73_00005 [Calditrichaeota bacterium]|nr:hypothetical protein [Calditrichota bacterium]
MLIHGKWLLLALLVVGMACQRSVEVKGRKLSLDGPWQFRFDPQDRGLAEAWYSGAAGGTWRTLSVPGTYNVQVPESLWYQGKAWYRRKFRVPANWPTGGRFLLRFNGVALRSRVWVNGKQVGEHPFAYTGFELDVTDAVQRSADNLLAVQVDNKILDRAIPDKKWHGWWDYGGIFRSVALEWRPDTYVANLWMDTRMLKSGWEFTPTAVLRQHGTDSVDVSLSWVLRDSEGNRVWEKQQGVRLGAGETTVSVRDALNQVKSWSPEHPTLYNLVLRIRDELGNEDSLTIRTGFRQIETRGSKIYLNGEPVVFRGISRHEDHPEYGSALPPELHRHDLEEIKALGCNFIRLAHYPQDPYVYDLADSLGLMVWSEIPAWQTSVDVLGDKEVLEKWAKPQLAEMINQMRHHPSVMVWSVGNEFDSSSPKAAWYVSQTIDFVHQLDPTRLATFASDRHRPGKPKDICWPYADFIAINEYYGWYYGTIHDVGPMLDAVHKRLPDKPIVVSEFGAGAAPGKHNPNPPESGKDYSEEYQVKFLMTHMDQIFAPERQDFMSGAIIWVYADFADPHRVGGPHPKEWSYVNLKGLVTRERKHKPSFKAVQQRFHELAKSGGKNLR